MPIPIASAPVFWARKQSIRAVVGACALFSLGCSVDAEEYSADEAAGSTHVAVRVRHVTDPNGTTRADALAGFIRAPARADVKEVLSVSGLGLDVPARGECFSESRAITDFDSLSDSELLEVDSVRLETERGIHELAPFAFPTVADLLRGVVYLSRDQSGDALPAGVNYTILGEGIRTGDESMDVAATQTSPPPLTSVTVGGKPLGGSLFLTPSPVVDLRWEPGENSSDLVVVTLESDDDFWVCTFADSEGFGAVPLIMADGTELGAEGRTGIIGAHRIRSGEQPAVSELPPITITFDFAVEAELTFGATPASVSPDDSASVEQD